MPKAERCRAGQGRARRCWVGPTFPGTWQHLRRGVGKRVEVGPEQDGTGTQLSCEDMLLPPPPGLATGHSHDPRLAARPACIPANHADLPPASTCWGLTEVSIPGQAPAQVIFRPWVGGRWAPGC